MLPLLLYKIHKNFMIYIVNVALKEMIVEIIMIKILVKSTKYIY